MKYSANSNTTAPPPPGWCHHTHSISTGN